uniref:Pentapeptide repeat-containing protein n=1 Tax=Thermogemmatispora argillosa TaxID=2045280 RepID=A0A455SWY6_9CHLR|nr:hypothetical protein KTA_02270 [Thermogemmatispora argillosa]
MTTHPLPAELEEQLQAHRRWLDSRGSAGHRLSLPQADLHELDLSNYMLSFASLRDCNLSEANLCESWLAATDLTGSQLQGALLSYAHAEGVCFDQAILDEANLAKADCFRARLRQARLRHLRGVRVNLRNADLQAADLSYADLQRAILSSACLEAANLRGANLRWATLSGANLRGANLQQALLTGALLTCADLTGARLGSASLLGARDLDTVQADWIDISEDDGPPQLLYGEQARRWLLSATILRPSVTAGALLQQAGFSQEEISSLLQADWHTGLAPLFLLLNRLKAALQYGTDWLGLSPQQLYQLHAQIRAASSYTNPSAPRLQTLVRLKGLLAQALLGSLVAFCQPVTHPHYGPAILDLVLPKALIMVSLDRTIPTEELAIYHHQASSSQRVILYAPHFPARLVHYLSLDYVADYFAVVQSPEDLFHYLHVHHLS